MSVKIFQMIRFIYAFSSTYNKMNCYAEVIGLNKVIVFCGLNHRMVRIAMIMIEGIAIVIMTLLVMMMIIINIIIAIT